MNSESSRTYLLGEIAAEGERHGKSYTASLDL
jgi:hypothetical protein